MYGCTCLLNALYIKQVEAFVSPTCTPRELYLVILCSYAPLIVIERDWRPYWPHVCYQDLYYTTISQLRCVAWFSL